MHRSIRLGLFKFPPLGARKLFKCPTNYYWTTSPQDKFHLQSNTLRAFQREICRNDTFKLLLKTLLKGSFTNKGEILSCKSVKPSKNRKNSGAYDVRTRDKSGWNSPPFQRKVQIPPFPGTMHSQMPGVCPGGRMLKFRIDRRINCDKTHQEIWGNSRLFRHVRDCLQTNFNFQGNWKIYSFNKGTETEIKSRYSLFVDSLYGN